jgi:hypothetical protein
MRKLEGICRQCVNATSNVYGEYCSKAHYRDHGGGYGDSWASNVCIHDQHQPTLRSLFEPTTAESLLPLSNEVMKLRRKVLDMEQENHTLRSLVGEQHRGKK